MNKKSKVLNKKPTRVEVTISDPSNLKGEVRAKVESAIAEYKAKGYIVHLVSDQDAASQAKMRQRVKEAFGEEYEAKLRGKGKTL